MTIKCFDCNSNVDIRCAVPYSPPSEFIVDCETIGRSTGLTYTHCRKISQIVKHALNQCNVRWAFYVATGDKKTLNTNQHDSIFCSIVPPDSRVIRECGSNITEVRTECFERHGKSSIQSICECDISYCNGTYQTQVSATVIFIVSLIASFTLKISNL